jgi:hypothetical protein
VVSTAVSTQSPTRSDAITSSLHTPTLSVGLKDVPLAGSTYTDGYTLVHHRSRFLMRMLGLRRRVRGGARRVRV